MKIYKLSANLTPLDEGVLFGIETENDTPSELVVEIIDAATEETVATQQLHNTLTATINIAPYIAPLSDYEPIATNQCHFAEAPTARYKIRIDEIESEEVVVSVNRCKIDTMPTLITSLPRNRRIARGENDTILFASEQGKSISANIVANTGEMLYLECQPSSELTLLTLSLEAFDTTPTSLELTLCCDETTFATLHYTVVPPLKNATRLAWLSKRGTIERYTFPSPHKVEHATVKRSVMTGRGVCSSQQQTKRTLSLCSRFEPRATVEALAEIVASPKVWLEHNGTHQLVEVATTSVEYDLFGEPSFILLDIALWQKGVALW